MIMHLASSLSTWEACCGYYRSLLVRSSRSEFRCGNWGRIGGTWEDSSSPTVHGKKLTVEKSTLRDPLRIAGWVNGITLARLIPSAAIWEASDVGCQFWMMG